MKRLKYVHALKLTGLMTATYAKVISIQPLFESNAARSTFVVFVRFALCYATQGSPRKGLDYCSHVGVPETPIAPEPGVLLQGTQRDPRNGNACEARGNGTVDGRGNNPSP